MSMINFARSRMSVAAAALIAALVALVALSACSATGAREQQTTAEAAAGAPLIPPADGGRYDTPQALIAALERRGVVCEGYDPIADPIGAVARGSCYFGEAQQVVSVYATTTDAESAPQKIAALVAGLADVDFVVGRNWTVNAYSPADAQEVKRAIGGRVVHIPA